MTGGAPGRGRPAGEPAGPRSHQIAPRRRGPEGALQVSGANEQSAREVDLDRWVQLARQVLETEGVAGAAELALLFVDEGAMRDLNRRFMDKDAPTDVLAFPIDEVGPGGRWPDTGSTGPSRRDQIPDDELPLLLGDVVVCPVVAARQAEERSRPVDDEIALLVVHGVLHVLGHDHAEPAEAERMRTRERDLLERFHRPGA